MVFDLVDKEGTKSGKGLGWSWFGLNDGKRDSKILRELGEIYKDASVSTELFDQKIKGLTVSSRDNAKEIKKNSANNIEFSKGLLNAAASADKMTISSKLLAGGMTALKIAGNMLLMLGISELISLPFRIAEANKEAIASATEGAKALDENYCIITYALLLIKLSTKVSSFALCAIACYNIYNLSCIKVLFFCKLISCIYCFE